MYADAKEKLDEEDANMKKIFVIFMSALMFTCFMPTMAFAETSMSSSSDVQIDGYYAVDPDNGALKTQEALIRKDRETEKSYAEGQVKVDKKIRGTSEENVFDVTLTVKTKDVQIEEVTSEAAAVVLVIDTSSSMKTDGKFDKIKTAAESFINKFAAEAGEGSKISIVDFSGQHTGSYTQNGQNIPFYHIDGAVTGLGWTPVNSEDLTSKVTSALSKMSAEEGGTNLEAGIQLAYNLLKTEDVASITNKNIVVLTDGEPTYGIKQGADKTSTETLCTNDTEILGDGQECSNNKDFHQIHTQVEALCKTIKADNIETYAIYVGGKTLTCKDGECDFNKDTGGRRYNTAEAYKGGNHGGPGAPGPGGENPPPHEQTGISIATWLDEYCGFTAYTTEQADDIENLIGQIESIINMKAQAWQLTDPMGANIEYKGITEDVNNGIKYDSQSKTLTWNLKKVSEGSSYRIDSEGGSERTYTLTYRIKLNNLADGFTPNMPCPANGVTSLTYYIGEKLTISDESRLKTAYFNIPAVHGLAVDLIFTKVNEKKEALPGAKFTLTTSDSVTGSSCTVEAASDSEGKVTFSGIPSGHTYTLTETAPPQGYTAAESKTVTVTYGKIQEGFGSKGNETIENRPIQPEQPAHGKLKVTKTVSGAANDDLLKGYAVTVTLTEVNSEGNTASGAVPVTVNLSGFTSSGLTKSQTIESLEYGKTYKVEETIINDLSNKDYTKSTSFAFNGAALGNKNAFTFTVPASGATPELKVTNTYNSKITEGSDGYRPAHYALTINKQVAGLDNIPAGYEVAVNITNKATGKVFKTVKLGANETETVFLPYGEYTLTEASAAVDGYKQVGQTFSENDFKLIGSKSITVTNTYERDASEPIADPDPSEPAAPADSAKPAEHETPADPAKADDEKQTEVPKTGDNTPMSPAVYGILAAGALLGLRKTAKRETK